MSVVPAQMPLQVVQGPLSALFFWVRLVAFGGFYFSTILMINAVQMASLLVRPLSLKAFRSVNRFVADQWWGWCVIGAEKIAGVELVLTGDTLPRDENAVVFANHQQMPDILVVMMLAYRHRRLGDLKFFVKDALKYVPGVGWGMLFLDCIFLKRDWLADKRRVRATFEKILKYRIPIWLVSFVEGTRLTPAKLTRGREIAARKKAPILDHVLVPRVRGFTASLEGLEGYVDAVYDLTIGYENGIPRLSHIYGGAVKRLHLDVRRFSIESLPASEAERSQWLIQRFVLKDDRLKNFYRTGSLI